MTTIDDLELPRSELTTETEDWARSIAAPFLVNHSVQSYVSGRALGYAQNLEPGTGYDHELLYLGCLLHDVGLTEPGNGEERFEADGADLAVRFLADNGLPQDRTEIVWDAIALHTSQGIVNRKRPAIALAHSGIVVDVAGGPDALPPGLADRTLDVLPRLGLQDALPGDHRRGRGQAHQSTSLHSPG